MLTFILGASLTLNLGLIYLGWHQDKAIEAAQEVINSLMEPEEATDHADSKSNDSDSAGS